MGRAAQRASNRKRFTDEAIGVRQCTDALMYLPPHEPDASLGFHQDQTFGTDRIGGLTVWIALDDVAPEQAALRFLTGSHREGPLGKPYMTLLDRYPKLPELHPLSPPRHFRPGDGSIHHGYTIHGRGPNQTGRPRWSFLSSYIPTDNVKLNDNEQSCIEFGLEVPSQ
jgi:ectoine hydroxylase-related dioxygenase (phytanoyl-CoA dioxygenase family)